MRDVRRSVIVVAAAAFGIVATLRTGPARAEERISRRERSPSLGVGMHVGIGTPYGDVGAVVEYDPVDWFVIAAGGGLSSSGPQWALMPRLRIPDAGVGFGIGVSGGPFTWHACYVCFFEVDVQKKWTHALWSNFELSYESKPRAKFRLRGYFGVAFLLNPGAYSSCATESGVTVTCSTTNGAFPYAGLALVWDVVR